MHILFLATWYPHRYDTMDGLFIRKHAQAVARQAGCTVDVLYICDKADEGIEEYDDVEVAGVRELTLYCGPFRGLTDDIKKMRLLWREWRKRRGIMPDIVHLNVISKWGWLARYLKFRYSIPYVITEHWPGYLPGHGGFSGMGRVLSGRWIVSGAAAVLPVSARLMSGMKGCGLHCKNWIIVSNVVDDFFFENNVIGHDKFRFIHVSCFLDLPKNVMGIVDAVALLAERRSDFEMLMVGTGHDWQRCYDHAQSLGLIDRGLIRFSGLATPLQVKEQMDESDCFVLFSNYELAPVVISEALTCGLPIISTPVGNAEVEVDDHKGMFVPCRDVQALADAMSHMIDHAADYDRNYIRSASHQYSFDNVGAQIVDIYRKILDDKL